MTGELPVPVPGAEVSSTLRAVEARIATVLDDLEADWRELAGQASEVLGEHDIPALVRHSARGGKRVRPQMVHWGWVAAGAPPQAFEQVVDLCAALELLHAFALVHDDVMDGSQLRRGAPSVHAMVAGHHRAAAARGCPQRYGEHIAILVGDLLHAEATQLAANLPPRVRAVWRTMMLELVAGQGRDITGAALGRRDLQQGLEVARLKSGSYTVQRPLQMGALLGGASPDLVDCLLRYGWHVGEAFGLRDDVLGTWGDPSSTGKSAEDDLEAGKPTVLLALAEQRLRADDRALLARAGSGQLDAEELQRLRRAMDGCGIRDEVERLIADEVSQALAALDPALVDPAAVAGLRTLTDKIAWRNS